MKKPEALQSIIEAIEEMLERYPVMWSEDATLAFSGGKDSIALASALAATGRRPLLRAVDMGYSSTWRGRIEGLAQHLGLPLQMLTVAEIMQDDDTEPAIRRELVLRRAILDDTSPSTQVSPCTNCYNCKILSLVDFARLDGGNILFAHHADDALSSFLKAALMYLDRWRDGNKSFDRDRFRALGLQVAADLRNGHKVSQDELISLIVAGHAHTSEPPIERREIKGYAYRIGRPMFSVKEAWTAAFVQDLEIRAESSGCGHTLATATRTPREIVHLEIIPYVAETARGREVLDDLRAAIAAGIGRDGTASFDARGERHLLLGDSYKGGPGNLADRL